MANQAVQKKQSSYRESIKSTPGQPSVTADYAQGAASSQNVLQLQRTAGNRAAQAAVMQLAGGDAKSDGGSQAIVSWLTSEAAKDKKTDLYGFFEGLSPMTQKIAINIFSGGNGAPSLSKAKKRLTGFLGRSVDWDKFSQIVRTVKGRDTKNYNEDTDRDYVTYATTAAAASVGASSAAATSVGEGRRIECRRAGRRCGSGSRFGGAERINLRHADLQRRAKSRRVTEHA